MAKQVFVDIAVSREGEIAILTMSGTDNRINSTFCKKWMEALDLIESWPKVKALITTGSGKFYCNGLDLEYLGSLTKDDLCKFNEDFLELRRRILFFPMVTVAAINGHGFAGGFLIALLHDYRVMQNGRGWLCMNEIDIKAPFSPSLMAIMKLKFTPKLIREVTIYGKRFSASKALEFELIDDVADEGGAVHAAIKLAQSEVKGRTYGRAILSKMKEDVYGDMIFDDNSEFLALDEIKSKL